MREADGGTEEKLPEEGLWCVGELEPVRVGLGRGCHPSSPCLLPAMTEGASGLKVCLWVCLESVQSFLETEGRVGVGNDPLSAHSSVGSG